MAKKAEQKIGSTKIAAMLSVDSKPLEDTVVIPFEYEDKLGKKDTVDIIVKHYISVEDMANAVEDVKREVYTSGVYNSYIEEISTRKAVFKYYTSIKTDMDLNLLKRLCFSPIYDAVCENIQDIEYFYKVIFNALECAQKSYCSAERQLLIQSRDALLAEQKTVLSCLEKMVDFSKSISAVDPETLNKFIDKITHISNSDIVNGVVSALPDSAESKNN